MTAPSFQMSADARLIYQRLKTVPIGETVSWSDLSSTVSRPLDEIRGAIGTARHRLLKDTGAVFSASRGEGLTRCTDAQIVDGSVADTVGIRRRARRAAEKLSKVRDYAALPPSKQLEHTTRLSVLAAIATVTKEPTIEKVRKAAQGRASELPLADTVRAFIGAA